jgi:hypothetical protein
MSKQDKVAPRTPADLERKYGKNFAEILGVATDARDIAKEAAKETEEIKLQVNNGVSAQFLLTIKEDGTKTYSLIDGKATKIHFESDSFSVDSTHFKLQEDGTVTIKKGDIGGCSFDGEGNLIVPVKFLSGTISANQINADGIVAEDVDLTGKITATEGSFGNSHITSEGSIFRVPYEGIYFGSATDDTFLGIANYNGYRAVLGLGMLSGNSVVGDCVLLTNKDIQFGDNALYTPITWNELRKAMIGLKRTYPDWFT